MKRTYVDNTYKETDNTLLMYSGEIPLLWFYFYTLSEITDYTVENIGRIWLN